MNPNVMTPVQAKFEASRCLMCADAPCACDCPAGVNARAFIRKIRFDNLDGAVKMLRRANVIAASCAFICPTDEACTGKCTNKSLSQPIDIASLQRFVMEYEMRVGMIEPEKSAKNKKPVAVIGAGPAGLGCAAELAVLGHPVTVFDSNSKPGGMLTCGIPSFRLPESVVDFDVEFVKKLGVEFRLGEKVEDPKKLLGEGFDAVFIATGLYEQKGGDLIGANLPGVYQALDFLARVKKGETPELGGRTLVIGGGDTAMDSARVAKKAGAESFVVYRRTQGEMPAYKEEIEDAWREGVEFYFRVLPRAIIGKEKVEGLRCVRIKWHDKNARMKQGYDVEGTEFVIKCDSVVLAIGQGLESPFGLRTTPNGCLAVDNEKFMTSEDGIFAGGDATTGGGTAAKAVGMGKLAATKISEYLGK